MLTRQTYAQPPQLTPSVFNWPPMKPHPVRDALWYCPKRFCYVPCGRQSGKTEFALRRLVGYLCGTRGRYFYAGPTFLQSKRTAWRRLIDLTPDCYTAEIAHAETTIRTPLGSELILTGLDKPHRIEGLTFDGGVVDETSDIKLKEFDKSVMPMLAKQHGSWVWFIGVPKRHGVGVVEYRRRYEQACRGELPESAGFWWPAGDFISEAALSYFRKTMDPYDYAEQFDAKWLTAGGGVFHSFDPEYNVRPCLYNPDKKVLVGSDFNTNPMCWVFCHLRGDVLEVFGEFFTRDTNTPDTLKMFLRRFEHHEGGFDMYGDASARGRHTSAYTSDFNHLAGNLQLKTLGRAMHYLRGNPAVADRFSSTNKRICDGDGVTRLYIDPHCTHLITDLEIRSYKPGTREAADSGDVGHPSDALGYICYHKWPGHLQLPGSHKVGVIKGDV